jgi:hypothetical protein
MTPIEQTLGNRAIGALLRPQKTRDRNEQKHPFFLAKTRNVKWTKTRDLP